MDFLDVVDNCLDVVEAVLVGGEQEEGHMGRQRRAYMMRERIQIDRWDDVDFLYRFRVSKVTFTHILDEIRSDLEFVNPR